MAGLGLARHADADAATAQAGRYDIAPFGNVSLLHMTDCHVQLKPIYFREPGVNLGLAGMQGQLPHLVGEHLLKRAGLSAHSAQAHAFTYVDFETAARRCGKVGGFAAGGKTLVTNVGSNSKFLGLMDFEVKGGKVVDFCCKLLPIFANQLPADPAMDALIGPGWRVLLRLPRRWPGGRQRLLYLRCAGQAGKEQRVGSARGVSSNGHCYRDQNTPAHPDARLPPRRRHGVGRVDHHRGVQDEGAG